jgi:Flp pilus assembly protein TadB
VIAVVALLCAVAAWLIVGKPPEARVERMFGRRRAPRDEAVPAWLGTACGVALGVGVAVLIGSLVGVALGIGAAFALPHLLSRLESRSSRLRRVAIARQLPEVADLLAATLASGAPPGQACSAVAVAVDEPLRSMLAHVSASLRLGATGGEAWSTADPDGSLDALSAAFIRSESSGAPIADLLAAAAGDLRRRHRLAVEVAARAAGVRAVAPLAACFLPAFLLVGAMPVVASMAELVLGQ